MEKFRKDSKWLWATVRYSIGKHVDKSGLSNETIIDQVIETNQQHIANAFPKHYSKVGQNFAKSIDTKPNNMKVNAMQYMHENKRVAKAFFTHDCTVIEVKRLIKELESKTSTGVDNISIKFLKGIEDCIVQALVILFNKSFEEGKYPNCMKLVIVLRFPCELP